MSRQLNGWLAVLLAVVAASPSAQAQRRDPYEQARRRLVEDDVAGAGVKDRRVLDAMMSTLRHEFVPATHRDRAYYDMALPIGDKQTISSPFIVAYMTESLDARPQHKVLEIGTGSGYQAAVLSPLVKDVYTIEIVPELGEGAKKVLRRLQYDNVHVKVGDGFKGWPEHAPFDRIIVTCSPEKVPQPLVDQLREGGRMVIPVGERYQQTLFLFTKADGKLKAEALRPTLFVPMTGAAEQRREVQPDPTRPQVVNGNFEKLQDQRDDVSPGWYYQRQMKVVSGDSAPQGRSFVEFTNREPGRASHLLQGLAIDGRHVKSVDISCQVKTDNVKDFILNREYSTLAMSFYDDQRQDLGTFTVGPFRGTDDWHRVRKRIRVPPQTREAILRIGLFGATGKLQVDNIRFVAE